ncbi:MAG: SsrA-binding protein [Planctomycetes bacterium]|nr:SsrA-binding protein [Planctomycetota bacterium]
MASKRPEDAAARTPTVGNPKARHRYEIVETIECGVMLKGPEVKSLRLGRASLDESYARFRDAELWLVKMHIDEYRDRGQVKLEPTRPRKLLLHATELARLKSEAERKRLTLVPLRLYWNARGIAKIELALVRGKKTHDKRETERKKSAQREMARVRKR